MKKSLLMTQSDSSTPTDPFGDGSGVSYFTFDSDSNSFDGTQSISSGTATRSTSVKKHGAASLDLTGSNSPWHRNTAIPSTFRMVYSNSITVTFWMYIDTEQQGSPINYSYATNTRTSFNVSSSNVVQITNYNGSSYLTVVGPQLQDGNWYFIANRIAGNGYGQHHTMTLDVDSTKYTTTSTNTSLGAWIERGIGRDVNAGYFNGYIDTLRAFNRILTDTEVAYIRNNDPIT